MSKIHQTTTPPIFLTCDQCRRPMRHDEAPRLLRVYSRTHDLHVAAHRSEAVLMTAAKAAGWECEACEACEACLARGQAVLL